MNISYEGIGYLAITVPAGDCVAGQVCDFDSEGKLSTCALGGMFSGVVEAVENGMAAVQVEGFVKQSYTGTAPSCGYMNMVGNGKGGIMLDATGMPFLVVAVDTTNKTVVFKL